MKSPGGTASPRAPGEAQVAPGYSHLQREDVIGQLLCTVVISVVSILGAMGLILLVVVPLMFAFYGHMPHGHELDWHQFSWRLT